MLSDFKRLLPDIDPDETGEWIQGLDDIVEHRGPQRADFVLRKVLKRARQLQLGLPSLTWTHYMNTISPEQEPPFPGDEKMELRIRRIIRWNAAIMVAKANQHHPNIGGHISTYASSASLYEVGFNHFFRGKDDDGEGDQIYYQGHAAPGIYSRAFLEGRLKEENLLHFRRETGGIGLSSYPHPRLMPSFWEFPTVSMGLGPINAIYQARFNRYLHARKLANTERSHVWAFLGDGECDEPEALGALTLAAREGLDNLTFVINCNLQRLDGPVRGNGKIIQELEAVFRGAGWNVIKVVLGREWDALLARDEEGLLVDRLNDTLDGDWQKFQVESGAYIREHFFGTSPKLRELVDHLSDHDLRQLRRGGHDLKKLFAAYRSALDHAGAPTVILAKTVKGWTLGEKIEARNVTHQTKKMTEEELRKFRDNLRLDIDDDQMSDPPFYHPGFDSPEFEYLMERRKALGGYIPRRRIDRKGLEAPEAKLWEEFNEGTPEHQEVSTTMAFSRMLRLLLSDKNVGKRIVPIIPDEARTFGMDPLFRQVGIYSPHGQNYEPVDSKLLLSYTEKADGQLLEEGITEAGAMASFTAAGTSYAIHNEPMIPFYTFYSMFGFQRTGDMMWAFGDSRGRGFLMGATAGRTTLVGEGLQHNDGHSHVLASTVPCVRAYDPAWAYELATIIKHGFKEMYQDHEDVFYYISIYNENYRMPPRPKGLKDEQILEGMYLYKKSKKRSGPRVQLFGSGPILRLALEAQEILADKFGVAADVWSVTSYLQLRNEALSVERWNRLHPTEPEKTPRVTEILEGVEGPIIAVSDWMKQMPDMISRWVPQPFVPLGTDGFGRSDTRENLRRHFEIDAENIVLGAISTLSRHCQVKPEVVQKAFDEFGVDTDKPDPRVV